MFKRFLVAGVVIVSSQAFALPMCINFDGGESNGKYYYYTSIYAVNPANNKCEAYEPSSGYYECNAPLDISVNGADEKYMCYEQQDEQSTCTNNYGAPDGCTELY